MRRRRLRSTARKAARQTKGTLARIPGPSTNPATNLLIMDVAMRGLSLAFARSMEKALLRTRYQREKASNIVKGRPLIHSMAATGAARMASRSVPGFLLVTGGLLAKSVLDRSLGRRESVRRGEKRFAERAEQAEE